jgi:hypothetical protein
MRSRTVAPLLPLLALPLLVLGGCNKTPDSTLQVKTHSAVVKNVARYRTYSHETAALPPQGYAVNRFTPEVLDAARREIDVEMQKRGYIRAEANGDIVVRISSGVRTVEEEPTGSTARAGAPVMTDRIGALVVDVFDRQNQGHLFHGYAKDEMRGEKMSDTQIKTQVTKILEPLPASGDL